MEYCFSILMFESEGGNGGKLHIVIAIYKSVIF